MNVQTTRQQLAYIWHLEAACSSSHLSFSPSLSIYLMHFNIETSRKFEISGPFLHQRVSLLNEAKLCLEPQNSNVTKLCKAYKQHVSSQWIMECQPRCIYKQTPGEHSTSFMSMQCLYGTHNLAKHLNATHATQYFFRHLKKFATAHST